MMIPLTGQKRKRRRDALYPNEVDLLNVTGWVLIPLPWYGQYLICPRCKMQVASVSNYCNFCGTLLRPEIVSKICPNCNAYIVEFGLFNVLQLCNRK